MSSCFANEYYRQRRGQTVGIKSEHGSISEQSMHGLALDNPRVDENCLLGGSGPSHLPQREILGVFFLGLELCRVADASALTCSVLAKFAGKHNNNQPQETST